MDTNQLIDLVADAQSKACVDWRPVVQQLDSTEFQIDLPCPTNGWTFLQWAIEHDNSQAANFAISRGASINAMGTGDFACTPLDVAVRKENDRLVDMFLRHGGTGTLPATSKRLELVKKGKVAIREFVSHSKTDSFADAVERFEDLLSVKPKFEKQTGLVRFRKVSLVDALSLTGKKQDQLARSIPAFAKWSNASKDHHATIYAETWLGTTLKKTDLVLAPTVSDMALLTSMTASQRSPLCGNHQLFDPLAKLYELCEFRVLSVNWDAMVLHFVEEIEHAKAFAEQAMELFPFLSEYHTAGAGKPDEIDVTEMVAEDIRDDNAIHIIYHGF